MAKKKKQKKKTRRNSAKNPALDPKYTVKSRLEYLDFDYLDKLNEEELKWLNKFSEEYVHASFEENRKKNLHSKKQELQIYKDNYSRQMDVLGYKKTRKMLDYFGDKELERKEIDMTDYIIHQVDTKIKE